MEFGLYSWLCQSSDHGQFYFLVYTWHPSIKILQRQHDLVCDLEKLSTFKKILRCHRQWCNQFCPAKVRVWPLAEPGFLAGTVYTVHHYPIRVLGAQDPQGPIPRLATPRILIGIIWSESSTTITVIKPAFIPHKVKTHSNLSVINW